MPVHNAVARNFAEASENKIHSDDIAKRFGFTGALVPGVTVFGHLAWPLTRRFGERWLQGSWVTTRFIKPAYHSRNDLTDGSRDGRRKSRGRMQERRGRVAGDAGVHDRDGAACRWIRMRTSAVRRGRTFASRSPGIRSTSTNRSRRTCGSRTTTLNREYAARVDDETELFRKGVLHPHAILSQANQVLVRRFVMPAWIHTGSEMRFRRLLRVGDAVEVRAVPLEKWERKGHQFIKLYVAYAVRGEIATEIFHTAIFRVRADGQALKPDATRDPRHHAVVGIRASGLATHSIS